MGSKAVDRGGRGCPHLFSRNSQEESHERAKELVSEHPDDLYWRDHILSTEGY